MIRSCFLAAALSLLSWTPAHAGQTAYSAAEAGMAFNGFSLGYTHLNPGERSSSLQLGYDVGLRLSGSNYGEASIVPWYDHDPDSGVFVIASFAMRVEPSDNLAFNFKVGSSPVSLIESMFLADGAEDYPAIATAGLLAHIEASAAAEIGFGEAHAVRFGLRPAIYSALVNWPIVEDYPPYILALIANPSVSIVREF